MLSPSLNLLSQLIVEPPQWQAELTKDELIQKLSTTAKSADHLNELLRESEATNAILMEQIKVSRYAGSVETALVSLVFFLDQMFNSKYVSENPIL